MPESTNKTHLRLLENWLPLAQEVNLLYGWDYDASALEELVITAADTLAQAHSSVEARVILWYYHKKIHKG
jgi:hypothetical protein